MVARNSSGRARRQNRAKNKNANLGSTAVAGPSGVLLAPSYGPVCTFLRTIDFNVALAATDSGYIYDFALSDLVNSGEFTALFTQWRITKVVFNVIWTPASTTDGGPRAGGPRLNFAMDPFATGAPATLGEIEQRILKQWVPNSVRNTFQLIIHPEAIALASSDPGAGGLVTTMLQPKGAWQSCATPATSYGRVLLWIENYNTGYNASGSVRMVHTYHMQFRGYK